MGTRSVFSFKGDGETHHVYQHWDGYPSGAAKALKATVASGKAWGLPRYEADEFAAAFVASNKDGEGNIRLTKSPRRHADIEYRYEVYQDKKTKIMQVKVFTVDAWDTYKEKMICQDTLAHFMEVGGEALQEKLDN